jgi:predicted dehydrogenase
MTKIVNVAIVGGGLMGREIAAALQRWPALIDHPVRPQVIAVCDINPTALDWFDQIPTVARKVTDYIDLLGDEAIDVLYVAVRHDLHQTLYVDTIEAGKSLLAEKPFGIDASAAAAIMAAASASPPVICAVLERDAVFSGRTGGDQLRGIRRPGPDHRGALRLPARQ